MSIDAPDEASSEGDRGGEPPGRVITGPVRRFMVARFSVSAAFQIQGVAVGWYIYALTGSALDLGLVGLAMFLPAASLALVAGQIIDRYPRRQVLLAAWTLQALAATGIAVLAFLGRGTVEFVFLLIACFGAGRAFDQPAQASLLPSLVPVALFPRVTPLNSLVNQFAVIIGPGLGGLLFAAGEWLFKLGAPIAFCGTVVMYLLGLAAVATLPNTPARPAEPFSVRSFLGGIDFIRRAAAVRGAITLDMFGVFFGGATALLPIFARDILMIGPIGLGLLRSTPAMGALAAGLYLARCPLERHVGRRMFLAVAVYGVATIALGLSRSLPLSIVALAIIGAADVVSVVVRSTLVQTATPDAIRGRVSAVNSLFVGTSNQLGEFESGVTAEWFGAVGSVVLGGVATLVVVAVASSRFPALRRMDRFIMAPAESD
ncbi:MAG TPA: MFS transporter [Stellaceae bacterium]|jgi:MFS family permease|nr:MFS transporter [Stellaceae bacterium]